MLKKVEINDCIHGCTMMHSRSLGATDRLDFWVASKNGTCSNWCGCSSTSTTACTTLGRAGLLGCRGRRRGSRGRRRLLSHDGTQTSSKEDCRDSELHFEMRGTERNVVVLNKQTSVYPKATDFLA